MGSMVRAVRYGCATALGAYDVYPRQQSTLESAIEQYLMIERAPAALRMAQELEAAARATIVSFAGLSRSAGALVSSDYSRTSVHVLRPDVSFLQRRSISDGGAGITRFSI